MIIQTCCHRYIMCNIAVCIVFALLVWHLDADAITGSCRNMDGQPQEACEHSMIQVKSTMLLHNMSAPVPRHSAVNRLESVERTFCYSLVRKPIEPTVPFLAKQLAAACDGWALFGVEAHPELNIIAAFSEEDNEKGQHGMLHEMVVRGVYGIIHERYGIDKFSWIVKLDSDSFVRPSAFKTYFQHLDSSKVNTAVSVGDGIDGLDGMFVALPTHVMHRLYLFGKHSVDCDVIASGTNVLESDPNEACRRQLGLDEPWTPRDQAGRRLVVPQLKDNCNHHLAMCPKGILPDESEDAADHTMLSKSCPCISESFISVHPVKDPDTYANLSSLFP
eukprot:gnl/TRDRNA2_/TRDRNA2_135720_c0_seq1.p1 gnl/TRDRNA2_/TRDRNA2_135720_c0~~gnl/TRDRNA2_/TRDRNA2_135720_c0_seq1.p1  ORF type:complete len:333 (-),score=44.47 gnl/TRDRNA2_/TRDRNA2_135720_c0_seq1:217-1215(-)